MDQDAAQCGLFEAAAAGDIAGMRRALLTGASPSATDARGNTLLHFALQNPPNEGLDFLLAAGGRLDAQNEDGATPAHLAFAAGRFAFLGGTLLAAGIPLDVQDRAGRTPLHCLLEFSSKSQFLIVYAPHHALLLVEHGASLMVPDRGGVTPLMMIKEFAASSQTPEMWGELLERGRALEERETLENSITPAPPAASPRI